VLPRLWVPVVENDERLGVAIVSSGRGGGGGTVHDRREVAGPVDVAGMHRVSRGAAGGADGVAERPRPAAGDGRQGRPGAGGERRLATGAGSVGGGVIGREWREGGGVRRHGGGGCHDGWGERRRGPGGWRERVAPRRHQADRLQPFSQKSHTPTVAKEFQIGHYGPTAGIPISSLAIQPFSQKSHTPTVAKEFQIGLYDPTEADLEHFWNCCSEGFLGERLYERF